MIPLWSAEARYAPECVNWNARIAESWACNIVSKLKVRPFQRVNSPLVDPVNTRRPSGVHYNVIIVKFNTISLTLTVTTLTGHRILFVDVCTNFVHNDVDGLFGYATGGRSWHLLVFIPASIKNNTYIDYVGRCRSYTGYISRIGTVFPKLKCI